MNFVWLMFSLLTTAIIVSSSLVNLFEKYLPAFVSQSFRYGKFSARGAKSVFAIEVPKSWFRHFYICASILFVYLVYVITIVYLLDCEVPENLQELLDSFCGTDRYAHTPKIRVYIAVWLLTLQVFRRLYDTWYVSVFGDSSKMNLFHYILGHIHYPGVVLAILSEAPIFSNSSNDLAQAQFDLADITASDLMTILIFCYAWKRQQMCTHILGRLRKNSYGEVVTHEYILPQGDWFEYFTAPHQTTEIIMYACITWLLWYNITWFYVFTWVLANQVETILLTHWWYQEKFEDFPKKRKALIPCIY